MKIIQKKIMEYERSHETRRGVRAYVLVKPLKDGECVIETHAAANKKNGTLVTKKIASVNTRSWRFRARDAMYYINYSNAAHDHWVVDMSDMGIRHTDHFRRRGMLDELGRWTSWRADVNDFPENEIPYGRMLNDFSGTKYRYCAYNCAKGSDLYRYLYLYGMDRRVELLSKAGLDRFINEEFIAYFHDDAEFAKWFVKNWRAIADRCRTNRGVFRMYGKSVRSETLERMKAERERKAEAARRRRHAAEVAEREKSAAKYDGQIRALYERVKDICTRFDAYEVFVPSCGKEMVDEGYAMHNCIGVVHPQRQGDTECCIFIRKDGKPFVDMAVDLKTFAIIECRLVNNEDAKGVFGDKALRIVEMFKDAYLRNAA